MEFEKFKEMFDECFGKVTPKEFVQRMENLGYKFQEQSRQAAVSGSLPLPVKCLNEHRIRERYLDGCQNINCCELCRRQ